MKSGYIISKRFQELENQIEEIEKTRYKNTFEWVDDEMWQRWTTNVLNLLQRVMGAESAHYDNFKTVYDRHGDSTGKLFTKAKGIFRAAKSDFEGGFLFQVEALISAEVLDDFVEQAQHLLESDYKDAAGIIAGVALETTLKRLCKRYDLLVSKLDKMNADLAKKGVYNKGMQKQITAWADLRNNAAHGNWDEYSALDVQAMIKGVSRFIGEYL